MRRVIPVLFAAVLFFGGISQADPDRLLQSLRPSGYVNDFAGVINPSDRRTVEALLTELEQKTGAQAAVVTLSSLEGGQIDDFAVRLFERWGLGRQGRDDGLLLIAAMEDRRVRIETGYGFEGVFPDAAAGRLIDQYVLPAFRQGDFSTGLRRGAEALASVAASASEVQLTGVPDAGRYVRTAHQQEHEGGGFLQLIFFIIIVIAVIRHPWLLLLFMSGGRGGSYRGGGFGGGFGGFGGGMSGGGGASRGW